MIRRAPGEEEGPQTNRGDQKLGPLGRDTLIKLLLLVVALLLAPWLLRLVPTWKAVEREVTDFAGESLGITEIVRQVKRELAEAELAGLKAGEVPLFEVEALDLELNFVVQESARAGVGSGPQLVVVDKESEVSAQKIQKIHLRWRAAPGFEGSGLQGEFELEDPTPLGRPPPAAETAPEASGEGGG